MTQSDKKALEEFEGSFGSYWSKYPQETVMYRVFPDSLDKRPIILSVEEIKSFILKTRQEARGEMLEEVKKTVLLERKKHKVFECGNRNYENWCENEECKSEDARNIKAGNKIVDSILSKLEEWRK